jgi:hypothetical protein
MRRIRFFECPRCGRTRQSEEDLVICRCEAVLVCEDGQTSNDGFGNRGAAPLSLRRPFHGFRASGLGAAARLMSDMSGH